MKPKYKRLILCLAIPLATGGLAALFSGGMSGFSQLRQPPLSPPGWLFPVVWTILYLLMGYASYRALESDAPAQQKATALSFYSAQLFVNFLWPILFFRFDLYLTAFLVLLVLWLLILLTIRSFSRVEETASDLLLPYLLWVTFAGYLNLGVFLLN